MTKNITEGIIKGALSNGIKTLLEPEAKKLISAWGIPIAKSVFIKNQEDIVNAKKSILPPFVLKVVSYDVLHKSEVGGVVTEIRDFKEIEKVSAKIRKNLKEKLPKAVIEGFILENMAPKGVEVIIGGLRDPQFGPAVMFGIGGIAVELMKDVSYRLAPLDRKEALEMIKEVKGYPLLIGFRGSKPVDMENLISTIMKLSEILLKLEEIREIEINPLLVYEKGVMAVDVKVVLNTI